MKIRFKDYNCLVKIEEYISGKMPAIFLYNADSMWMDDFCIIQGLHVLFTATSNMPDEHLNQDEVIIRNYDENEGIYECLVKAQVISEAIRFTRYTRQPICKLLLKQEDNGKE